MYKELSALQSSPAQNFQPIIVGPRPSTELIDKSSVMKMPIFIMMVDDIKVLISDLGI
jgi:hypothetical protein